MAAIERVACDDKRLIAVFSYPHFSDAHYEKVLDGVRKIGTECMLSKGTFEIGEIRVLGKGWVGIVSEAIVGGKEVALKIRRSDANRASMNNEARLLESANSLGVGPKLLGFTENVLAMEFIDGALMPKWLKGMPKVEDVRSAVGELLEQCFQLDKGGIDHGELSDAKKHIIINGQGRPYIIDFETASTSRKCRNLASIIGYLFFKDSIGTLLTSYFTWDKEFLKNIIKKYKMNPSEGLYEGIRCHLGISQGL
jgi:putative serine/threonine protein kinase